MKFAVLVLLTLASTAMVMWWVWRIRTTPWPMKGLVGLAIGAATLPVVWLTLATALSVFIDFVCVAAGCDWF